MVYFKVEDSVLYWSSELKISGHYRLISLIHLIFHFFQIKRMSFSPINCIEVCPALISPYIKINKTTTNKFSLSYGLKSA